MKVNFDLEENVPIRHFTLFAGHSVYQITSLPITAHLGIQKTESMPAPIILQAA